jgi:uncharacterized protein YkwD
MVAPRPRPALRAAVPLGATALAGLLLGPTPVAGAADDAQGVVVPVGAVTRDEAIDAYDVVQDGARVPAGWTGSTDSCAVGTESAASTAATLDSVNAMRSLVGAAPVTLDATLNRKALAAALMMRAQGDLSHSPGPEWRCWSADGAEAAGSSNLFLGASGARAVEGFVDDEGIGSLGHRRWVLNPEARTFGTGSTGSSNALWVFGPGSVTVPDRTAVAWPPAGWVAAPWLFADWSVEIVEADVAGLSRAQVAVTIDGRPVTVTGVREVERAFGPGSTLSWRVPAAGDLPAGDHAVTVSVSGLVVDGDAGPITWSTRVADPDGSETPAQPPRFLGRPTVSRVDGTTARVRPGTELEVRWDVEDSVSESVAWTRDGRAVRGARSGTYVVRQGDRGHSLKAVVTATGEGGTTRKRSVALVVR